MDLYRDRLLSRYHNREQDWNRYCSNDDHMVLDFELRAVEHTPDADAL